MKHYFTSYTAFKGNSIYGYGDHILKTSIEDKGTLLGDIKKDIKQSYYFTSPDVRIVLNSLNEI